jgi:hypothetical protein
VAIREHNNGILHSRFCARAKLTIFCTEVTGLMVCFLARSEVGPLLPCPLLRRCLWRWSLRSKVFLRVIRDAIKSAMDAMGFLR